MDVGAILQSARERRGLSLDELARRTKISVRVLRAIESNAFDMVPQGIFIRGFLRAYAREVGLDPTATVEQYLARLDTGDAPDHSPKNSTDDLPTEDPVVVTGHAGFDASADSGSEAGKAIAIALVSLGFVTYLSLGTSRDSVTGGETVALETAAAPAQPGRPEVLLASDAAEPVATSGDVLEIELSPTALCWVEAVVDGSRSVYRLMQAGDRQTLTVHESLALRVGNPAAFSFSVNGKPGRLPGQPYQPVTIRVDPENFTKFLAP
jgi:cytoskeletal protein RodZ